MNSTSPQPSRRSLRTTRSVRVAEVVSRVLITGGGIGTIAAVALIFIFLLWTVFPLFGSGEIEAKGETSFTSEERLVHAAVDEYGLLVALLFESGAVQVKRLDTGELVGEQAPFDSGPTAWAINSASERLAWGTEDSYLYLAEFGFETTFPRTEDLSAEALAMETGALLSVDGGIMQLTTEGNHRAQRFVFGISPEVDTELESAIVKITIAGDESRTVAAVLTAGGQLVRGSFVESPFDEDILEFEQKALPFEAGAGDGLPAYLAINERGNSVLAVFKNGHALRYDVRGGLEPSIAEALDLLPETEATITAFDTLVGSGTALVGDSDGGVTGWFLALEEEGTTSDGSRLVPGHTFDAGSSPVRVFASSSRSRAFACGFEDGGVRVAYMTNERIIVETETSFGAPTLLRITPKEDGVVAFGANQLDSWLLDVGHPEAGLAAYFAPIWYEGYPRPDHTWQAEGATDDNEPKFGFMPLVFGTLKATFYSMLFGAPLALLAAIFTSEFLDRRLRIPIKSSIEIMASLPSVVLGFLAGLVIAPYVQSVLPSVMASFLCVPLAILFGAYLWQLLPQGLTVRMAAWPRLLCMAFAMPIGLWVATLFGPVLERVFFAGDVFLWLDGQRGTATAGWVLVLLPLAAVVVIVLGTTVFGTAFRRWAAPRERRGVALADIARFVTGLVATVILAWIFANALNFAGLDPRDSFLGTYDPRNALIVGFAMGFAVVPIIYTLAEDALSSVPQHLRLASLGAGATQWQTAIRVVVPTAMSGLFSAMMIGLGRAVGETMIVLMATGNTPMMDMNLFNGFRSLAANIAYEMPEAVVGSTHYRTLFLAGLVLFAMTFVLNTIAEVVRLHYRKRSGQL